MCFVFVSFCFVFVFLHLYFSWIFGLFPHQGGLTLCFVFCLFALYFCLFALVFRLDSWSISSSGGVDFVLFVIVSYCLYLHLIFAWSISLSGCSEMHLYTTFHHCILPHGPVCTLYLNLIAVCINGIFPQPGGLFLYFVLGCKHFKLNLQRALPPPI